MRGPVGPWIPAEVRADPRRLEQWLVEAYGRSVEERARMGGQVTLERHGVDHYRRMERARKRRGGGRPPASAEEIARRVAARRYWIARGKELEE
jgi:hypothetical protein